MFQFFVIGKLLVSDNVERELVLCDLTENVGQFYGQVSGITMEKIFNLTWEAS